MVKGHTIDTLIQHALALWVSDAQVIPADELTVEYHIKIYFSPSPLQVARALEQRYNPFTVIIMEAIDGRGILAGVHGFFLF